VEKGAHLQSLNKSPLNVYPAKFPSEAPTLSDFLSQALLPHPSGSPGKEPSYYLLKFPVYGTPSFLNGPLERERHLSPELSSIHSLVIHLFLKVHNK
jgi:hypothetical protein